MTRACRPSPAWLCWALPVCAVLALAARPAAGQSCSGPDFTPPPPPYPSVAVSGSPWAVVSGDFVGPDGKLDVVVTNATLGKVTLLQGGGDGSLLPVGSFDVGAGPEDLVAADFDRDGLLDLAVANSGATSVSILPGTGTSFGAASAVDLADPPSRLAVADFNRDGMRRPGRGEPDREHGPDPARGGQPHLHRVHGCHRHRRCPRTRSDGSRGRGLRLGRDRRSGGDPDPQPRRRVPRHRDRLSRRRREHLGDREVDGDGRGEPRRHHRCRRGSRRHARPGDRRRRREPVDRAARAGRRHVPGLAGCGGRRDPGARGPHRPRSRRRSRRRGPRSDRTAAAGAGGNGHAPRRLRHHAAPARAGAPRRRLVAAGAGRR